ncbi:hypothetical protein [Motiliproteus sp. MSK22-1]|uniref:hypothetical protein n=1 Tax=Motiliproteus sp. MSK22-1 TaxID=1897630 RepID=UPI00097811E2|nr:hypothetical protein [Motiliproteus sp. MSK22-1]OMH34802.1 hypothetical protein BGP75_10885 [Motiliproteus sp. MSK22-1]
MSVNELLSLVSAHNHEVIAFFVTIPLITFILSYMAKPAGSPGVAHYALSGVVYLVSFPGMFAATLVFYALLIAHQNMLEVNAVVYFLPILSMGLVFYLIRRKMAFERLPGFGRLSGLMLLLLLVCIVILFLYRLRFVIGFFSSIESLGVIAIVLFLLFKWATAKMMGHKK